MNLKEYRENWTGYIKKTRNKRRSENTIKQYERALTVFYDYLKENKIKEITIEAVNGYIDEMLEAVQKKDAKQAKTVNGKRPLGSMNTVKLRVRAINALFDFANRPDLKSEIEIHSDEIENTNEDILSDLDFLKLLDYTPNEKLKLIYETLAFTGLRVSELEFITVESLKDRTPIIWNKRRRRKAFIPQGLAEKLKDFADKEGIKSGIIFRSRPLQDENGQTYYKMIDKTYIQKEMKRIAGKARIKKASAHPHALRHYYADKYANMPDSNPYLLPRLLGHSTKGMVNDATTRYVTPKAQDLLEVVDILEAYINGHLNEARKKREVYKRRAEQKKQKNRSKKQ